MPSIFLEWVTHGENCLACDFLNGEVRAADDFRVYPGFHKGCDCTLEPITLADFWHLPRILRPNLRGQFAVYLDMLGRQAGSVLGLKPFPDLLRPQPPDNMISVSNAARTQWTAYDPRDLGAFRR